MDRAVDAVDELKPVIEQHLYGEVITLRGLDLRLCCYDLTSTLFRDRHHRRRELAVGPVRVLA